MKRGFVKKVAGITVEQQVSDLLSKDLTEKEIYVHARGAEDIHALLASCRGQRCDVFIASDLRVLGNTRDEISDELHRLQLAGLRFHDVNRPTDDTHARMLLTAVKARSWDGDKRRQRRKGRLGGLAKATRAELKRAAVATPEVIRRLCAHPKLTWNDCEDILGISKASLQRHYRVDEDKAEVLR